MAVNFKLTYNNGFEYVNLFPKTRATQIRDSENLLKTKILIIDNPTIININLNEIKIDLSEYSTKYPLSAFFYLIPEGITDVMQVEIDKDIAILIRSSKTKPPTNFRLTFIFKEQGVTNLDK